MDVHTFLATYRLAWEKGDEELLVSLFSPDGVYHNTPFDEQRGHEAMKAYWQRTKLQRDVVVRYEVLQAGPTGGVARWRTTYQVTSEKMFEMWAASTGTNLLARKPGDPLPRLALDGIALVELGADGLCRHLRLWWHGKVDG